MWEPKTQRDKDKLKDSGISFSATKEVMEKLEEWDYDFTLYSGDPKISKITMKEMYNFQLDFKKSNIKKVCIRLVEKKSTFLRPDGAAKQEVIEINMSGSKLPFKQLRYNIYAPFAYSRVYRDGRMNGRQAWYSAKIPKIVEKVPEKILDVSDSMKKFMKAQLKLMSFNLSSDELDKYFSQIAYRYSPYNFYDHQLGMNFDSGLIISQKELAQKLMKAPKFGKNAFKMLSEEEIEERLAIVGHLMKFYNGFLSADTFVMKKEYPSLKDIPNSSMDRYQWHFFSFLLELIPQYEIVLLENCYERGKENPYLDAHENLYCDLLEKEIKKEGKKWKAFLNEKYKHNRSLNNLEKYISLRGRANVVKSYLKISKEYIKFYWPAKRQDFKEEVERNLMAVRTARAFQGGIEKLREVSLNLFIMNAKGEGMMLAVQLQAGEITQAEFDKKMENFGPEKKAKMIEIHNGFEAIKQQSREQLAPYIEDFQRNADKLNPFDHPFDHM